jgi:uncharacterized membrane protein YuzA (DUF378 family)
MLAIGAEPSQEGIMTVHARNEGLSGITWVAVALVVIGAINWGLVGLFELDLVATIFGRMSAASRVVYVLVAVAGLYLLGVAVSRLRESPRAMTHAGSRA